MEGIGSLGGLEPPRAPLTPLPHQEPADPLGSGDIDSRSTPGALAQWDLGSQRFSAKVGTHTQTLTCEATGLDEKQFPN